YFSQILISQPRLVSRLGGPLEPLLTSITPEAMRGLFTETIADAGFDEAAARLRCCWYEQIIKIGRHDLLVMCHMEEIDAMAHLRQISLAQTALAEAALAGACELACARVSEHYQRTEAPLVYTILGLGRLGHYAIDYNSGLDIIFVYSD